MENLVVIKIKLRMSKLFSEPYMVLNVPCLLLATPYS